MVVSPAKNRNCRATVPKYMNIAEALLTAARQRESIAKRFSRFTKKPRLGHFVTATVRLAAMSGVSVLPHILPYFNVLFLWFP